MAYAPLVGTIGAASMGASGAAVTPAWGTGQNRKANNLLVCFVVGNGVSTYPTTPTGWSVARQVQGASALVTANVLYKQAAGGDAAPTIAALSGQIWAVQLCEYIATAITVDQSQTVSGNSVVSGYTMTNSAADARPCDLVTASVALRYSAAATKTIANAFNNGATANTTTNGSTSTASHYSFGWGVTNTNSAATQNAMTWTSTQLVGFAAILATFGLTALFATLVDAFGGTSVNTALWNATANVVEGGGTIQVTTDATSTAYGITSYGYFDLTNSGVWVQLVNPGSAGSASGVTCYPLSIQDAPGNGFNNTVQWELGNGSLYARSIVGGGGAPVWSAPYNPSAHAWLRIREASGTVYWDYSADGNTWINAASEADPFVLNALLYSFMNAANGSGYAATTASIANLNVPAPPPANNIVMVA